MPDPATGAVIGGLALSTGATLYSSYKSSGAAKEASSAQQKTSQMGIDEQKRQFDTIQELLKPYISTGTQALNTQKVYAGLGGGGEMEKEIQSALNSPEYQAMLQAGEQGILSNASATGGLRGGNIQSALGQFRPQLLTQILNDRYSKLSGLSQIGQNSAVGQGSFGMQTGSNISNLLGDIGSARAGGILGQAAATKQLTNVINSFGGQVAGYGLEKLLTDKKVV